MRRERGGVGGRGRAPRPVLTPPPSLSVHSYGGIGGLSEKIGWTDVQREDGAGSLFGGPQSVIFAAAAVALADSVWFLCTSGPALLEKLRGE